MGGSQNNGEPFCNAKLADALQGTKKIVLVKNPVNRFIFMVRRSRAYNAGIENGSNSQRFLYL
jgi:chorismate mutase